MSRTALEAARLVLRENAIYRANSVIYRMADEKIKSFVNIVNGKKKKIR